MGDTDDNVCYQSFLSREENSFQAVLNLAAALKSFITYEKSVEKGSRLADMGE
ncbi:MAG: hypothetical protein VKJ46_14005 [Leptolyngbyaceae bacterium]|nr:hypothetical protein [Leptolyngbyaceae bacterium]